MQIAHRKNSSNRVHFDFMGCPLIGDDLYKKKINLDNINSQISKVIDFQYTKKTGITC